MGLRTYPFESFGFKGLRPFRNGLKQLKPSFIFVYGGKECSLLWANRRKVPSARFRGEDRDQEIRGRWRQLASPRISGVLTPSVMLADLWGSLVEGAHAVPYGVDGDTFQFEGFFERGPRPILLILGRLDPIKGHEKFFKLFKALLDCWPKPNPPPFLRIVGEPANLTKTELVESGQRIGLVYQEDFEILDERLPSVSNAMKQATCGVIPSLGSEVICRVGAEFLNCGAPLMISNVGSLPELLFPKAGIDMDRSSPQELAQFVLDSYSETVETRAMRAETAAQKYSLHAMGLGMEGFMKTLTASLP